MVSIDDVRKSLSFQRIASYENLKGINSPTIATPLPLTQALDLYAWNAQIAAVLIHPLHICEVVVRNGIAGAIEAVYGAQWPWSIGFPSEPAYGAWPQ